MGFIDNCEDKTFPIVQETLGHFWHLQNLRPYESGKVSQNFASLSNLITDEENRSFGDQNLVNIISSNSRALNAQAFHVQHGRQLYAV